MKVTNKTIKELADIAKIDHLDMIRLCLHEDVKSELMAMVIVIRNKYIYPIHRHSWKDESYVVLQGECIYREYQENKKISKEIKLTCGDFMMNNNRKYHSIEPLTDMLCFVEHTNGPFLSVKPEYL